MIDIHAPSHAPMTRREFFVHLFIVVLGILIAIGLEQSVEWLHHRHERNDLIVAMRAEAENNRPVFESALSAEIAYLARDRNTLAALRQARPQNGAVDVALPPRQPSLHYSTPARATWTIAKTNGKVALLPENLAEIYNRLDFEAEAQAQAQTSLWADDHAVDAIYMRLGIDLAHAFRLHLSVADRDALAQALAQRGSAWSDLITRTAIWQGANNAVTDGIQSRAAMEPYMLKSVDAVDQAEAQAIPSGPSAPDNPSTTHAAQEHTR